MNPREFDFWRADDSELPSLNLLENAGAPTGQRSNTDFGEHSPAIVSAAK
jgi:hypothetical protein